MLVIFPEDTLTYMNIYASVLSSWHAKNSVQSALSPHCERITTAHLPDGYHCLCYAFYRDAMSTYCA